MHCDHVSDSATYGGGDAGVAIDAFLGGHPKAEGEQLWGSRLHGQGKLLGIQGLERGGIAVENMGELPGQTGGGGDGPCLHALADLEV
jgi:hypothetical protein